MSQCRIIIKNLPPKTTEETLRQRFGRHGLITDCRLMKTQKGQSRRFAFIGFQTESMAHQSLKENSAYLGKYKLEVSYALPQNNCDEIKPWSKYNTKSTAFKKTMERKELLRAQRKEKLKKSFTEMVGGAGRKELKQAEALEVNSEEVATDTGRLYVRNLPFSTTEESLRAAFSDFGTVQDVYLPLDEVTKEPRGFAFVTFLFPDQAIKALHHFDGSVLEGRVITVKGAQEKPATHEYEEPRKLSFSGERERELRKKADKMEHTWNLLYVSSDAALNVQAQAMDVEKSDLLDLDESGVAVRTALAETKLIEETKDWLKREGIPCEPEVFENSFFQTTKKRSDTCLILKNLPAETEYASLVDLIDKAVGDRKSSISRVCLAPSRTCCILQCEDARSAKHIFGKLAFRRYHHKPLYLEYAPMEVYVKTEDSDKSKEDFKPAKEPLVGTVFAKNLNFKTTEADLTAAFKSFAGFKRATLMTKAKKQFNEDLQQMQIVKISAGYAFIEFRTHKDAGECVKRMQHKVLDDHRLELEISHAGKDDSLKNMLRQKKAQAAEEICSAKLCVRNLAFQATQKDLVDLFSQFGQVVSCRIPMKIGNTQHRGFGFITLATQVEAREATEALRSTHLYGRHLIIENAREEEDDQTTEMVEERTTKYITGNKGIEYHACSYKEIDVEKQKNGFCATEVGPTGEATQIQSCIKECGDFKVMEKTRRYWDWVRHVHQQTRLNAKQGNMKRKRFTYRKDILVPLANYHNAALKNSLYQQLAKSYQTINQEVEKTSKKKLKEYGQIRAQAEKDSQTYVDQVKGLTPKYEKVLAWPTQVFSELPGKANAAFESIRQLGDPHLQRITQIYQAKARAQKKNMERLVQLLEANWKQANQELKAWKQEYARAFQAVDLKALQQPTFQRAAAITQKMQGILDAGKPLIQGISPALKASLVGEKKDIQELAAAKAAQTQLNEAERQAHTQEFNRQFNLQNGVLTQRLRDIGQLLGSLKKSAQAEDSLYTPRIEQLTQQLVDLKLSRKARQAAIQKLHTQRSAAMSSYFQDRVKLLKDRYTKGLQTGQTQQKADLQMFEKEAASLKANWQSEVKKASDAYQKDLKGFQTDLGKSTARLTAARERDIAQLNKMTAQTVGQLNELDQASNAKLKGFKDQFATLEKAHLEANTVKLRKQAEEIQAMNKAGQTQLQQASQAAFQNVREIEANLENTLNQGNSAFLAGLQQDSQKSSQQGQQELNRQRQLAAGGLKSSALLEAKAAQEIQKKMEEAENGLETLRVKIQKLETKDNASLAQSYTQQTASQQKLYDQLSQGLKDQQQAVNAKEDAYNQVLRKFGHTYQELRIRNMSLSAKFDAELELHRRKAAEKVNQLVSQLQRSRETHRFELAKALHQGALTIADQRSTSELAGLNAELEFAQQMSDKKMDLARLQEAANQKDWDQTRQFNKEIRTLKIQGTADMLGSTDRLVQHLENQEKQFAEANQDFFKQMNSEEDRVVQELEKIREIISTDQNQQAMAERSSQTKAHQKLDDLVALQLDLDRTSQKNAHELAQKVDDEVEKGTQETRRDTSTQLLSSQVKTAQEGQRLQDQETKHRKATDEAFLATNKVFLDQALAVANAMNQLKAEGLRQELAVKSTQQDRLPLLQEKRNQLSSLTTIANTI